MNRKYFKALTACAAAAVAFAAGGVHAQSLTTASKLSGKVHLLPATLETTQWGWFDNAQAPVLTIDSGDTVVMETMMHAHNQIVPGKTIEELKKLRVDNPGRGPHTLTGPIYVNGAEPGDVLLRRQDSAQPAVLGGERHADRAQQQPVFGRHARKHPGAAVDSVRSSGQR